MELRLRKGVSLELRLRKQEAAFEIDLRKRVALGLMLMLEISSVLLLRYFELQVNCRNALGLGLWKIGAL